jgi:hypothetical protein
MQVSPQRLPSLLIRVKSRWRAFDAQAAARSGGVSRSHAACG